MYCLMTTIMNIIKQVCKDTLTSSKYDAELFHCGFIVKAALRRSNELPRHLCIVAYDPLHFRH